MILDEVNEIICKCEASNYVFKDGRDGFLRCPVCDSLVQVRMKLPDGELFWFTFGRVKIREKWLMQPYFEKSECKKVTVIRRIYNL